MTTLAIVNQKGGSAKTTTTVNLGASLASLGKKVLIIDVDPQRSSTSWLRSINKETEQDLFELFTAKKSLDSCIQPTEIVNLFIVPSSPWLIQADKVLSTEVGAELILKKQLAKLEALYDYVLIDCPPALNILSLNALVAAQEVLVPLETRIMALEGLAQLLNTIETVKDRLNPDLTINGILPCRVDKRTRLSMDIIKDLQKRFNRKVYKSLIRENVKLAECPSFGKPINLYDPYGRGTEDYRNAAKELIRKNKS